jgi:penicillin-binding protein 1A
MWMQYMETALRNTPDSLMPMPQGVMTVNIDPTTGVRDAAGVMEYFYQESPPPALDSEDSAMHDENAAESTLIQPQRLLQPDAFLSPR